MILVTGCAGFIGSHLTEKLLSEGYSVTGVDSLTDYYSPAKKEKNMQNFINNKNFIFIKKDINELEIQNLKNISYVIHLAAQAGIRSSWGENFELYTNNNILATQRLLELSKNLELKKFIYASSSSVYGDVKTLPLKEDTTPKPISPYGVTKLAGEHLCTLYNKSYNTPVSILRYFTVYGPRQRPDMAFYKFIESILNEKEIIVYGDGKQTRDFTYVDDIVKANILAMNSNVSGIFNIGCGKKITLNKAIEFIEKIAEKSAKVKYIKTQRGDVKHTEADITMARKTLFYEPNVRLEDGLRKQVEWMKIRE